MIEDITLIQKALCSRYGAEFLPVEGLGIVGISDSAIRGDFPIHGLRHPPQRGTTGWYIWGGDYSESDDFFKPYHASHTPEMLPIIEKYMALPPGWRFLTDAVYEDVWFDLNLLSPD